MIEDLPKTIRSYLEGRRAEDEDLQLKDLGLSPDAPLSSSGTLDKALASPSWSLLICTVGIIIHSLAQACCGFSARQMICVTSQGLTHTRAPFR